MKILSWLLQTPVFLINLLTRKHSCVNEFNLLYLQSLTSSSCFYVKNICHKGLKSVFLFFFLAFVCKFASSANVASRQAAPS